MLKLSIDINHYHKCCIIIADELKRICEKHNLRYSLIGGTLLGAVRHKGFIPWDDDMDFCMPREDYEKFLKLCKTELKSSFAVLNSHIDYDYPFSYSKIILKGTEIEESFCRENPVLNGIFVDIFPYDKFPKDFSQRKALAKKAEIYKRILWMKKGYGKCIKDESLKQRIKYNICKIIFAFLPYDKISKKYNSLLNKYSSLSSDECYLANLDWPFECLFDMKFSDSFDNLTSYPFENSSYQGFSNSNLYLSKKYGKNYMHLPDEKDRVNHGILKVDFGEY